MTTSFALALCLAVVVTGFRIAPQNLRYTESMVVKTMHAQNLARAYAATGEVDAGTEELSVSMQNAPSNTPLETLSDLFVEAWLKALNGKLGPLKNVMRDEEAEWISPIAKTNAEMKSQFVNFAGFFSDPALTVFDRKIDSAKNHVILDYQLSFWYPLPWRPRIIVPGRVTLTANADNTSILSVVEEWEVTIPQIIAKQALPRLWDIWHIFSTPCPEFAPSKVLGREGGVSFVEMPPSIALEATWTGPAKYPGPPLLTIPGFSLFGALRTSSPNKDPFQCTLPVESLSDSCTDEEGQSLKRNSFLMHVPSQLHAKVAARAKTGERFQLLTPEQEALKSGSSGSGEEGKDDVAYTSDAQVGISDEKLSDIENISLMKSVTGGKQRGNFDRNIEAVEEFVRMERIDYGYRTVPRRVMAQVRVKGEVTPDKVKGAVEEIKMAVLASRVVQGYSMREKSNGCGAPLVGFQMYSTKACFNMQGEPAMAIYEIQFDKRETSIQVELDLV